ncbi:MAG TPA: hypothetical protein VGW34_02765 [Allosphingosinicella sp.]|nr:hypothetical protein [Allosphingosinicella sp.]
MKPFLAALRRTGNARLAARMLGVHRSTYLKRRARNAAFAQDWEAAVLAAHAAFKLAGGERPPENGEKGDSHFHPRSRSARTAVRESDCPHDGLRTKGGELTVVRLKSGRLQLRRAPPGRMTEAAGQAFCRALAACANVRLAAAAVGFAHSSFYARKRRHKPFAREMRLALEMGYERVEWAALAAALPESHADDGWRHADPPPVPPMSPDQALQLLCLHEKSVRQSWDQPHRRRRRGESEATYVERLRAMWATEKCREAEDAAVRRAARYEATGGWRLPGEEPPPKLPPLELVTGWSKANPDRARATHNPDLALFGGWRIGDWKKRQGKG